MKNKIDESTFAGRLRKSRLDNNLEIKDLANICNVTNGVISGYEVGRYYPTIDTLKLIAKYFDIDYICSDGYTYLIWNYSIFLNNLKQWINNNNLTREEAANLLGITRGTFRFWFNGSVIKYKTYCKIKDNLIYYELI